MQSTLSTTKVQPAGRKIKSRRLWSQPVLFLAAFWFIALAFVGIAGNFPLNDDWIYAESVQHFLDTGEIRLLACAPACLFQILVGAGACKIAGFSYEVLRMVGFFFAVLGSFFLYGCCRQLRMQALPALILTLCFAANPLYLCLAFSFMTDTPAIAMTLAYTYFLLDGLRKQKESSFFFSALCLLAATCVRQNLGFLALVNAVLLLGLWMRKKHSWTLLLGLVFAPLATGFLADKWMLSTNDFTSLYVWYKGMVAKQISLFLHRPSSVIPSLAQIAGELLCYLGLFVLPVLVCFLPVLTKFLGNKGNINPVAVLLPACTVVFSLTRFIAENRWMPFSQNLLRLPELGAHTILGINQVALSQKWRMNLTWISGVLGVVLGAFLLDTMAKTTQKLARSWKVISARPHNQSASRAYGNSLCALFAVSMFLFQFAFNTLQSTFSDIDRYYLFPLLGVCLCLALAWRWHRVRLISFLAIPLIVGISAYSLMATQDMMAWNRARWQALAELEAKGVHFKKIDGGAEYNYARDPHLFKNLILHENWYEFTHRGEAPRDQWRWWTVAGEDYIVSFSPVPNYEIISKFQYWSALSGNREILVLKKSGV